MTMPQCAPFCPRSRPVVRETHINPPGWRPPPCMRRTASTKSTATSDAHVHDQPCLCVIREVRVWHDVTAEPVHARRNSQRCPCTRSTGLRIIHDACVGHDVIAKHVHVCGCPRTCCGCRPGSCVEKIWKNVNTYVSSLS